MSFRGGSGLRLLALLCALGVGGVGGGCTADDPDATEFADSLNADMPPSPPVRTGPITAGVVEVLSLAVPSLVAGSLHRPIASAIAASGDGRLGWVLSDLLRFSGGEDERVLVDAFSELTNVDIRARMAANGSSAWQEVTDLLILWDLPAPPGYREFKAGLFLELDSRWKPIFNDETADIDWRHLSWGGVLPDSRPLGDRESCVRGCIPALDDPPLTDASEGDWYPDVGIVFGVTVGDTSVAFPKNMMEVHEMVNITIAGRRLGIPYCTLCGSVQAYETDRVPGASRPLVLRTSGLLSLSNKVMYDLDSGSAFETFKGRAISGPLHKRKVTLPMVTPVVTTWGKWRAEHPATQIVARDGGLGRTYALDPLQGRDDNGPIFPIDRSDTRLTVHTLILGVVGPDGPVAFPVEQARAALEANRPVAFGTISLRLDGGGLRASIDDVEIGAHQAFWFAWAQFHPGTAVWSESPK